MNGGSCYLFLQHFLQMTIIFAGGVGKFGRSLAHQQLALGPRIVLFRKYSSQFGEDFQLQDSKYEEILDSAFERFFPFVFLPSPSAAPATSSSIDKSHSIAVPIRSPLAMKSS